MPGEFCTGWAAGGACWESFVPVEASWHGARGRCESTVGTKGPAARAVGRMGASVSVVLGITGRCPAISHAIPREYHTDLYQFMMLCHLCFGISCEIGGGARYWGEVACWARTGKEGGGVLAKGMRACIGKGDEGAHQQRERAYTGPGNEGVSRSYI